MREHTCIAVGAWVEGTRRVNLGNQRKPFKGWVLATGDCYDIYDIEDRRRYKVSPEYVWSMGIDPEVRKALIDFTLEHK